jgi:thiosulfate dehydrogenase [quinone] large subunit
MDDGAWRSVTVRGGEGATVVDDPPLARLLFADRRFAWLWLPVRLCLGWLWLEHAVPKLTNPAWMKTGVALKGYWEHAVSMPAPPAKPPIEIGWYRDFIEALLSGGHYTWFAKLVALGEVAVGAALVLGAFTGIAAFSGGRMNWSFIMAGTAATNGLLFALATWLVLAWKTAGWIGLDYWLLPLVGTPWRRGPLLDTPTAVVDPAAER